MQMRRLLDDVSAIKTKTDKIEETVDKIKETVDKIEVGPPRCCLP